MYTLRPAQPDDAVAIFHVMSQARVGAYQALIPQERLAAFLNVQNPSEERLRAWREKFERKLKDPEWTQYVIVDQTLVAYCAIHQENGGYYISQLHTHPDAQGHGYGSRLLKEAITLAQKSSVSLDVARLNTGAQRLYERYGFEKVDAERKTYYGLELCRMSKH